jgi:glutathione peroxidase-family protein
MSSTKLKSIDMTRDELIPSSLEADNKWRNRTLPFSIYDINLASADGKINDILKSRKGKVTLLFNVAAGCGNIPQHSVLEELNQKYKSEPDFDIVAVVVDDFVCHGYPEFQDGLVAYIEKNQLDMTPGEVAQNYAKEHFGATYQFSELTNGRFDKHSYSPDYVPGKEKLQEQHSLWWYLTGAYEADLQPNGVPYQNEVIPWSYANELDENGQIIVPKEVKTCDPLRGNFEKFLIDRTGRRVKRYANGFLLGERNVTGETFPWISESWTPDGRRNHNPKTDVSPNQNSEDYRSCDGSGWPNVLQRRGIDVSLELISKDIDDFLNG